MSKQTAGLPCIFCGEQNTVIIRLNEDNDFNCESCNKTNAVYIDIETVAKTEPIQQQASLP